LERLIRILASSLREHQQSQFDVFIFLNRTGTCLKSFLWDRTGFVILSKRLENGKFRLRNTASKLELDEKRLKLLLDGVKTGGNSV
jgi:hypothetical protein